MTPRVRARRAVATNFQFVSTIERHPGLPTARRGPASPHTPVFFTDRLEAYPTDRGDKLPVCQHHRVSSRPPNGTTESSVLAHAGFFTDRLEAYPSALVKVLN